jgi:phosphoserine phosphatase RsbU/P
MTGKPAAYQLSIYISSLFVIVFGLFIYWSFDYNRTLIRQNAGNSANSLSSRIIGEIHEKIFMVEQITENLAIQIPVILSSGQFPRFLTDVTEKNTFVKSMQIFVSGYRSKDQSTLFFAGRTGDKVHYQEISGNNSLCSTLNQVILQFQENNTEGWSEAYYCEADSDLVVMYYTSFKYASADGMTMTGYAACELSLDFLNSLIIEARVGENGYAFLMSSAGILITHPMKELVMNRSLSNLPDKVFKGSRTQLEAILTDSAGSIIVYPDLLNHARSLSFQTKISHTGWILALVLPLSEINRELYWYLGKMVIILLIGVMFIFFAVFSISQKVMRPLSQVTREIQTFSYDKSEYDHFVRNEAESLTDSLNRLRRMYENFRLNEEESKKKSDRIEQDLLQASELQRTIIPAPGNWELSDKDISIYSVFRPAKMVSGDLYDFFMIDDHRLLITIGDVSGTGISAALFMSVAHTFIRSYAKGRSAKKIIRQVNKELCKNNSNQFFITLLVGILDIEKGILKYCNAGHTPSILIREGGKVEMLHEVHGLPLGLHAEREYHESHVRLYPADKMIFYTDGVTDQMNESGISFGKQNFKNIVHTSRNETPQEIGDFLIGRILNFAGGEKEKDDISILIMQYLKKQT